MMIMKTILEVVLMAVSLALTALILMHKGKGGGMSALFAADSSTSGVAERNLNRLTVGAGLVWTALIVALDLLSKMGV